MTERLRIFSIPKSSSKYFSSKLTATKVRRRNRNKIIKRVDKEIKHAILNFELDKTNQRNFEDCVF